MPALADPKPSRGGSRWADLGIRAVSAVILVPVAIGCILAGGWAWAGLMLAATLGLGLEWSALCTPAAPAWAWLRQPSAVALPIVLLMAAWLGLRDDGHTALSVLWIGTVLVFLLARFGTAHPALPIGVLYLGLPILALIWLRAGPAGIANTVFVMVVVWATDIGAYIAGRLLGGPKLAPAISPGKTVSGAAGGLLAGALAGAVVGQFLAPGSSVGLAFAIALVLALLEEAGDLLESWIKRRFGVKDSGRLIPGHGGLLDRLDGLLAAAPAAAMIAIVTGRGGVLWQ